MKTLLMALMMATVTSATVHADTTSRGRILVIVSSENQLQLQDGKTYPTGYYLNELTVPVRALMDNGYDVTFADPRGNTPTMDEHSDSAHYFGDDVAKFQDYKQFHDSLMGLKNPMAIADVIALGLDQFDGVFFPGGHAPMIDLLQSPDVRTVLEYFHATSKPTALICHGPISLLAALPNATDVVSALRSGDVDGAQALAQDWIYAGYQMTIFSTAEEQHAEAVQLGGKVLFYPDVALHAAGGNMNIATPWTSNVVRDRELITGQNPFSDVALASTLLQALSENAN
jgi:putative intracellular protease/amidase